jgi:hypothetical protein
MGDRERIDAAGDDNRLDGAIGSHTTRKIGPFRVTVAQGEYERYEKSEQTVVSVTDGHKLVWRGGFDYSLDISVGKDVRSMFSTG